MAIGTQDSDDQAFSEINMIPFIDVMLVLLIIFIVTVPVLKHAASIELPQATSTPLRDPPPSQQLEVSATGDYRWNGQPVSDAELGERLQASATESPQPPLHIRADKAVRYERVAQALSAAQRAGVRQIAFVTEPQR